MTNRASANAYKLTPDNIAEVTMAAIATYHSGVPGIPEFRNARDSTVQSTKSSMAKSLPVENLLPQNVGSIINYLQ